MGRSDPRKVLIEYERGSTMVDVVLLRMKVTSGWPQRLMDVFVRVLLAEQFVIQRGGVVGTAFRHWINSQLEPILVDEEMYTETIFLD